MSDSWKTRAGRLLIILGVAIALGVLLADAGSGLGSIGAVANHEGHAESAAPIVHSPAAIGLAVLGLATISSGLIFSHLDSLKSVHVLSLIAGLVLLYADGLLHWFAVVDHLGEPLSAYFFIAAGAVQVAAVPLVLRRQRLLWWIGVPLTVFFIEFYVLTRIVPPPFSFGPESLESLGTLSKATEVGLLAALGVFFGPRMIPMRLKGALVHGPSLALLFLGASASLITINLEFRWYWWIVTRTAFVLTVFLIIGLIAYAGLAYYLRTAVTAGMAWSFVLMLVILHGLYAVDYARASLAFPIILCVVSGILLTASVLPYRVPHSQSPLS